MIILDNINDEKTKVFIADVLKDITDGCKHGFFECIIKCEIIKGNRRRVTYRAGKSYTIVISEDDIKNL